MELNGIGTTIDDARFFFSAAAKSWSTEGSSSSSPSSSAHRSFDAPASTDTGDEACGEGGGGAAIARISSGSALSASSTVALSVTCSLRQSRMFCVGISMSMPVTLPASGSPSIWKMGA
eukprot:jgi/Chrpa1/20137/Chrysochromulina_OHIO_Genome00000593-RA